GLLQTRRRLVVLAFDRVFRTSRDGLGDGSDYEYFRGLSIRGSFVRRSFNARRNRRGRSLSGLCGSVGRGGFGGLPAFGLKGLALQVAHFLFKSRLEVCRGFAEIAHQLPQPARNIEKPWQP